jgi:hypothetical protein
VILLAILLRRSAAPSPEAGPGLFGPTPAPWTLDLSGTWSGQTSKLLPGPPPRPVLTEVQIETDAAGDIFAARAVLTDPGRGGAGGGYRIVEDGPRRLRETVQRLAGAGGSAPLDLDFIQYSPWIPGRERRWRALEGQRRRSEQTRYLLLESVENDYLVQAGINETGFLSYAFFSPQYAAGRGTDTLSRTIRPDPGSSLRGFRNLVWDLSGSADFVSLRVKASLTGPGGPTERMELVRETRALTS